MKAIHVSGKRKSARARATLSLGNGIVRVNNALVDHVRPEVYREKIREPLMLAGDTIKKVDVDVKTRGGGVASQAEAARLAIARALATYDKSLQKTFLDYDRSLLVADVRLKETHKPNRHGKARAKRQKSYR